MSELSRQEGRPTPGDEQRLDTGGGPLPAGSPSANGSRCFDLTPPVIVAEGETMDRVVLRYLKVAPHTVE